MGNLKLQKFIPVIITMPSIILGAIAMFHNKISTLIWAQNIACLVVGGVISYFIVSSKWNIKASKYNGITILIVFLFLLLTFLDPGMNGVHRWISIGIIKFNVSMILLPLIIIALWRASQTKGLGFTLAIALAISILLAIQPDASELTGFAVPMMILLYSKTKGKISRLFIIAVFSILIILSWVFLDSLPAITYVERIISLLNNMGFIWLTLGIISLAILPVPFILFPPKNLRLLSICVGLYFIIILISTIYGNFPVPLMGYGISPIIGYFIPITWYTESKINS
ncbi:hypothetical protein REC12_03185 [Desulfosporosinus sp. PR]|uniref:hypothetical protein n=1 Tax=Candidatus Desulfosporosinus nitrosoreducens TaxID=3401928 RepID=UPI0027F38B62|nr:hypothetical protein [Desulfosporosinus sp. PR]MDQ7092586.1 hypothetical protein [Desulfosporosinus sp. PR]